MTRRSLLPALALATAAIAGSAQAADGAKIFQLQCKTCHGAKSTPMAPSLAGVAGRKIASLSDFTYSAGLKAKTGTWTDANLDVYLAGPSKFAPGTRMPTGVAAAPDRTAVIGYLKTLK
ncbi:cytochrome c family protein [Phenylobacterium aquaticum]|uniref:c-type cytochrome n=1 Tax=Phenylobacterium aquaticum TaxID=1763816 RepID=UPI0026EC036E|nr:c-type cytochrome [Phenylobacterium aquaticum]